MGTLMPTSKVELRYYFKANSCFSQLPVHRATVSFFHNIFQHYLLCMCCVRGSLSGSPTRM